MRNATLARAAAATLLLLAAAGCASASPQPAAHADDPLARLLQGNERYLAGTVTASSRDAHRRAEVAQGQQPFAIVVSCSDSRVGPEVVFDEGLGDLFVVRTAGEVVDDVALGSIEYAVEHLHAPLILVLGHARCGAVDAAVSGAQPHDHVAALVEAIKPAVAASKAQPGDAVDNAVREQVRHVVTQLRSAGPVLADLVKAEKLAIVGARYDLDTGRVEIVK